MTDFSDIKVGDKVLVDGRATGEVTAVKEKYFSVKRDGVPVIKFDKFGHPFPYNGYWGFAEEWSQEKEDIIDLQKRIMGGILKIREESFNSFAVTEIDLLNTRGRLVKIVEISQACISDVTELLDKMVRK